MGFASAPELEAWLQDRDLSHDQFMRLMGDEARRSRIDAASADEIENALVDEVALAGALSRLQSRADEKHAVLGARGVEQPALGDAGLSERELIAWLLAECGHESGDTDPEEVARRFGFLDKDDLLRAALREYCYRAWKNS